MSVFEQVEITRPEPPLKRWRISTLRDAIVEQRPDGRVWYYAHFTASGFCADPSSEPNAAEILGRIEAVLSSVLATVRELLAEVKDSPQVDFPAAVVPAAAMERGE